MACALSSVFSPKGVYSRNLREELLGFGKGFYWVYICPHMLGLRRILETTIKGNNFLVGNVEFHSPNSHLSSLNTSTLHRNDMTGISKILSSPILKFGIHVRIGKEISLNQSSYSTIVILCVVHIKRRILNGNELGKNPSFGKR